MEIFKAYLTGARRLSRNSVESYAYTLGRFRKWLQQQGLGIEQLTYRHLLLYIKERLQQGETRKYINQGLTVVRHYFEYLIYHGAVDYNPASTLYVRGVVRRLPHGLLDREELDRIYRSYRGGLRNKVLLGMLVFQGLTTTEIQQLEPRHVDMERKQLHVPDTCRSNGRILQLETCQLLPLHDYLTQHSHSFLFTTASGSSYLTNVITQLMEKLRRTNSAVRNAMHLRMSVISHWLRSRDVRVVQHMAGHRHVSSTQRYQQDKLRALQQEVSSFHPLG